MSFLNKSNRVAAALNKKGGRLTQIDNLGWMGWIRLDLNDDALLRKTLLLSNRRVRPLRTNQDELSELYDTLGLSGLEDLHEFS